MNVESKNILEIYFNKLVNPILIYDGIRLFLYVPTSSKYNSSDIIENINISDPNEIESEPTMSIVYFIKALSRRITFQQRNYITILNDNILFLDYFEICRLNRTTRSLDDYIKVLNGKYNPR